MFQNAVSTIEKKKPKRPTKSSARPVKAIVPTEIAGEVVPAPVTVESETPKSIVKRPGRAVTVSHVDPLLQAYLREVQKYPLLTREEERELAIKYHKTGDREALQRLVTSNLRFVVKIAYEYVHYRLKLLDLIQDGNMGLVKAVQEFDPFKEVRLTTYAVWWIRSYIQEALLKNYSLVKMGTTQAQKKLFYRLRSEQNKLEQMGMVPGNETKLLASRLDVREKDITEMTQRLSAVDMSLNAPISSDEKKEYIQQLVDPTEAVDVSLGDAEQKQLFSKILAQFSASLEGREKVIFSERMVKNAPAKLKNN